MNIFAPKPPRLLQDQPSLQVAPQTHLRPDSLIRLQKVAGCAWGSDKLYLFFNINRYERCNFFKNCFNIFIYLSLNYHMSYSKGFKPFTWMISFISYST